MASSPTHLDSRAFGLADMPVPMVFAAHRIIVDCNAEFADLFGFTRAELLHTSFARLYPKIADFVRVGEMWRAHLHDGHVYYDERIMEGAGGHRFWCAVNGRSRNSRDPFAEALYCFSPMSRPVGGEGPSLTDRQRQILTLVAQGKTNADIAREIGVSVRTVEAHRLRMCRAVGARNSAELIGWFAAGRTGRQGSIT